MKFNMSSEKVDDLKDYVIKLLKKAAKLQGVLGNSRIFLLRLKRVTGLDL